MPSGLPEKTGARSWFDCIRLAEFAPPRIWSEHFTSCHLVSELAQSTAGSIHSSKGLYKTP
jgi:hypothetical protein